MKVFQYLDISRALIFLRQFTLSEIDQAGFTALLCTLPNGQCPTFDISLFIRRPLFECFGCLLATNVSQIEEILGHKSCHTSLCLAGLCFSTQVTDQPCNKVFREKYLEEDFDFWKKKN